MEVILVPTDLSERSDRALRRAALLARQFEAAILLVHVIDDDQPSRIVNAERDETMALLRKIAATLHDVDGVACETRVILASPFVGIAQAAADAAPDLLVIGPHRRQVLKDVFVGTTAERTIRSVDCPVLMVNAAPAGQYRHALQTTDLSAPSRDGLQRFKSLGLGEGIQNSLLYLFDAPALRLVMAHTMSQQDQKMYVLDEQATAETELAAFSASAGLQDIRQLVRYEATAAQHEVLKIAEEEGADLIVMSTNGRGGIARILIGSVTEQVLRNASVDVLAIPPRRQT